MKYKVVAYQGSGVYYVVCREVQQCVYSNEELQLNHEYEGTLDYSRLVNRYPTLVTNGYQTNLNRRSYRGV